ncbi:MAG TPA: ThuA domain-containing protein [Candidatus Sumerlaeota bacterium]|nr:ThuA domain-containing protein [Candidatus Sumerlaeota bacterium]
MAESSKVSANASNDTQSLAQRFFSSCRLRPLFRSLLFLCILQGGIGAVFAGDPLQLHPENAHYFLWRSRPVILITSTEHYGSVLNRDFDFKKYLATLEQDGLNLTRTFSGAYCEAPGNFNIKRNTMAPLEGKLLCPWARSSEAGYAGGGNKFDLTQWNPEYFQRLRDFVTEASNRGIVVEFVLFCPFYEDSMWNLSPMNATNNVNGIGKTKREEVYTLKHSDLQKVQEDLVRKIVQELKDFDNLYYEICNEPYFGGVTLDWQARIAQVLSETETAAGLKQKHLIAQNIANESAKVENLNPLVSILNFHYAKPPKAVAENYALNRVISDDETGFAGSDPKPYLTEAWDFVLAGGGAFDNLDYSFSVGHEAGDDTIEAPGTGGVEFRKQLTVLRNFIHSFDFIHMKPDTSVIQGGLPEKATARVLAAEGTAYALYLNGGKQANLDLKIPAGQYTAQWINIKTGATEKTEAIQHKEGICTLKSPEYDGEIGLRLTTGKVTLMPVPESLKANMPAVRPWDQVKGLFTADKVAQDTKPLHIVLVAGLKDHGPGEHDYPAWLSTWATLLAQSPNVRVTQSWEQPTLSDLETASTIVWFRHMAWEKSLNPAVDAYFARGGGMVFIHYAVDAPGNVEDVTRRIGLTWEPKEGKYRHGLLDLDKTGKEDNWLWQGLPLSKISLHDETYWKLQGDPARIQVLATANEDGQPQPMFWCREENKGRVFVCIPGHYNWSFNDPLFRALLLRGIAWSANKQITRFDSLAGVGVQPERPE